MNRFSREASSASVSQRVVSAPGGAGIPAAPTASSPEDARRLLEEVQQLGTRMRLNRRKAQQIDRRAAAYASRLARHTARLLQHMPTAIPAVRPVQGTGASSLRHYVLKHDHLDAPDRVRLLVVSSDGRLRMCTVLTDGARSRLWTDYEVANPPVGLGLSVVFEGLSSMIVKLETAVVHAETASTAHGDAVDGLIANSEARLANAGSRLTPVESLADDADSESGGDELYGLPDSEGLRSHGFEHRLPFAGVKTATPVSTPGRFQR